MADFFINPWMLSGLALLSAPIIIHLLNKKRFVIVDWAAMDFLFRAESRNRRRIRVEDLILLLLRVLLVGLIVLALSRPVFQNYIGEREDERTVVIDDSFSMEAGGGTGIPFFAARAAAERQVEEAVGRGIAFNVWLGSEARQIAASSPDVAGGTSGTADPGRSGGGSPGDGSPGDGSPGDGLTFAARSGEVLRSLRELRVRDAPLGVGVLLERLRERFVSVDKPLMRSVVLLSDYRQSDWMLDDGSELRPEIVAGMAALEKEGLLERIQWRFVDFGNEGRENLAVVGLRVDTDVPTVRAPVRVTVEIENFGEQERRAIRGWVEVGRPVAEGVAAGEAPARAASMPLDKVKFAEIDAIPAGEKATATVELTIEAPGEYPLTAVLDGGGDRLQRDDRTHAVLQVRRGLKVLLVDGDPGQERFEGEAGFLAAALAPRGPLSSDVEVTRIRGEITDDRVRGADVILVLNRADFDATELALLRRFVRRGGGLGYFLGSQVRAERYAQLFPAPASAPGGQETEPALPLFPVTLGNPDADGAAKGRAHLTIADAQHPAFEVFRGVEGSSLEQVGFARFFKIELHPGARAVARYDDDAGTPAIIDAEVAVSAAAAGAGETGANASVSRKSATGKVVVFNLTADRDWSDWPTDPSYPIVLQEWVRYLAPRLGDERRSTVGAVLSWDNVPGVRYDVVPPSGEVHSVETEEQTATKVAYFRDTYEAGFYRVVPSPSVPGAQIPQGALEPFAFACVRDARESRLAPADETRIMAALEALGANLVVGRSERGRVVAKEEGGEIWRWLAMGAGIFLVVELFTAWWMGRR